MTELYHVEQLPLFPHKKCTSCNIEKPLEEFYKQSPKRGGYQAWCIACWNERRRLKRLQAIQNPPNHEPITSQICKQCGIEKSIDSFYAVPGSKTGYRSTCKDCADRTHGYKKIGKRRNKPIVQSGYKWCYKCESEKAISEFREDKSKHDGLATCCKDCWSKRARQHWQNNREQYRMYSRNHYEHCIEQERTRSREKSRRPRSRLLFMGTMSRREARKRATMAEDVDFRCIIARDGYHCYICEQAINPDIINGPARLSFDHVIPLAKDGTHTEDNIKPTHLVCNQRKNRRLLSDMIPRQRRGPDA